MNEDLKIEQEIEKLIFSEFISLPSNKRLIKTDIDSKIMLFFINTLNDNSEKWKTFRDIVFNRLIENQYIAYKKEFHSIHITFSKGLCFDDWRKSMENKNSQGDINIGSINANNLQVGNQNEQNINITISELVEKVAQTDDIEAKSKLKEILENSTVGSIIGAGVATLLALL